MVIYKQWAFVLALLFTTTVLAWISIYSTTNRRHIFANINISSIALSQIINGIHQPSNSTAKVLILAYQRTGSTFVGKFFDKNKDVFYVYEPLDAAYVAMYGTQEGGNVPSDIRSLSDGSRRSLPSHEADYITNHLHNLFNCNFDRLSTEFLGHKYWTVPAFTESVELFRKCLPTKLKGKCLDKLTPCPKRLGENWSETGKCHQILMDNETESLDMNQYKNCMGDKRRKLKACLPLLQNACSTAQLRVAKTVRASFEVVERLLVLNPDLYIIHLYRNPLSVSASRLKHWSVRGLHSGKNDTIAEARMFCSDLLDDIETREQLKKTFPGRIINIYYDEMVKDPLKFAASVYSIFLNKQLPRAVNDWLTQAQNHSQAKGSRSRSKLANVTQLSIKQVCREFYDLLPSS